MLSANFISECFVHIILSYFSLILERKGGREREEEREEGTERKTQICCFTCSCIHWWLLARNLTRDRSATLTYWDDALTN